MTDPGRCETQRAQRDRVHRPEHRPLGDLDDDDDDDDDDEDEDEDDEEAEVPVRTRRNAISRDEKLDVNPKVNKKARASLSKNNPAGEGTKRAGFIQAMFEKPRTIADHIERAEKRAKNWGNGIGSYKAVADDRMIGLLRRLGGYVEHDEDEDTFHLLGFVKNSKGATSKAKQTATDTAKAKKNGKKASKKKKK